MTNAIKVLLQRQSGFLQLESTILYFLIIGVTFLLSTVAELKFRALLSMS
jgi:hypothetical protein